MLCLSNPPSRLFALFVLGLTIGTTNAIAQPSTSAPKPAIIERCQVELIDEVRLASSVPGVLSFVTPGEGDEVQEGQVLAGLQVDVIQAQKAIALKEAENDVEVRYSRKAAELADAEYLKSLEANRRLKGVVAAVEIDRLRLAAERAHLQIEQAEHQLEVANLRANEAEANFQVYHIKAPFTGIVTRKFKSLGEAVGQNDPVFEVKSSLRVRVVGEVSVSESYRIKKGDPVKVQIDVPDVDLEIEKKPMDGVLRFVDIVVQPVTQKVRVWAEVQNPNGNLKAGLTVKMTILPAERKPVQTTMLDRKLR